MKRIAILTVFFLLLGLATQVLGDERPELKDRPDRLNYALGFHLGEEIKTAKLVFRPDLLWQALNEGLQNDGGISVGSPDSDLHLAYELGQRLERQQQTFRAQPLWQGLYDAIDKTQPQLTEAQMRKLLEHFMPQTESEPAVAVVNEAPAAAMPLPAYRSQDVQFMSENARQEGVVVLPSGLQYRVLEAGPGKKPTAEDRVVVEYRGESAEGQLLFRSLDKGIPAPQEVEVARAVGGMGEALKLMHEGDRWQLYIPSHLVAARRGPLRGKLAVVDLGLLEILPKFQ